MILLVEFQTPKEIAVASPKTTKAKVSDKAVVSGPDQPTTRTVETLFRELNHIRYYGDGYGELKDKKKLLRDLKEKAAEEFLARPNVIALTAEIAAADAREEEACANRRRELARVRRRYYAHGLTAAVAADIQRVLALYEGARIEEE